MVLVVSSHTTSELPNGGSEDTEFNISDASVLRRATSNTLSRIRLYSSADARTADTRSGTNITNPPEGLLVDMRFTEVPGEIIYTPGIALVNTETPILETLYVRIFNLNCCDEEVSITLEVVPIRESAPGSGLTSAYVQIGTPSGSVSANGGDTVMLTSATATLLAISATSDPDTIAFNIQQGNFSLDAISGLTTEGLVVRDGADSYTTIALDGDGSLVLANDGTFIAIPGGGSGSNLGYVPEVGQGTITNDNGTGAIIPAATSLIAGLMTTGDYDKLTGIQSNAQVNTVIDVAGKTGEVDLEFSDLDDFSPTPDSTSAGSVIVMADVDDDGIFRPTTWTVPTGAPSGSDYMLFGATSPPTNGRVFTPNPSSFVVSVTSPGIYGFDLATGILDVLPSSDEKDALANANSPSSGNPFATIADIGGGGGAPVNATYLTLSADGVLTNERVFTPSSEFDVSDNGAGNTFTMALASSVTDLLPSSDEKDALESANSPSSGNPFATIADVSGGGAPADAQYLTLSVNGVLTNERIFTPSSEFDVSDGGAGNPYTFALASSVTDLLPTTDEKAALAAANSPSGANAFATVGDLPAAGAPTDAFYLTLSANGSLSEERVFTPSLEFEVTDNGPGAAYTFALSALVTDLFALLPTQDQKDALDGASSPSSINPFAVQTDLNSFLTAVNLGWDAASSTVTNSAGTDAQLTAADSTNPGLLESEDYDKLSELPGTVATVNVVAGEITLGTAGLINYIARVVVDQSITSVVANTFNGTMMLENNSVATHTVVMPPSPDRFSGDSVNWDLPTRTFTIPAGDYILVTWINYGTYIQWCIGDSVL